MIPQQIQNITNNDIFRLVFESAIEGLLLVNKAGNIILVNPRMSELFQYEEAEMVGKPIEMLLPMDVRGRHVNYREGYTHAPKRRSMGTGYDLRGQRKDGSTFPLEVSLNYLETGSEPIIMALVIDITERKKVENALLEMKDKLEQMVIERTQQLEQAVSKLESTNKILARAESELVIALEKERELSELKSRFISTASHEFRTPLATVLSSASLISKYIQSGDVDMQNKHIERIKQSVNNLKEILEDLLSLEKLGAGQVKSHPEKLQLDSLLKQLAEEMQHIVQQGQVIVYEHQGLSEINLDPKLLRHVVQNLISNAIKFSRPDTTIRLQSKVAKDKVSISIGDEGIGIPEEDQKNIFDHFFRGKNAVNIQGTGLGLNIVRQYTELMGGTVSFTSLQGKGTTFTVCF